MPSTITRKSFRTRIALAHKEAGQAQNLMLKGITATVGFPSIEDRYMTHAISRLEAAAQMIREALARVEDGHGQNIEVTVVKSAAALQRTATIDPDAAEGRN